MSGMVRKPSASAAFAEQLRIVGWSLRGEALVAGVLLLCISIGIGMAIWREDLVMTMRPDNHPLFGLIGALLPFAVWKRRDRLHEDPFLTLPVEHRRHALLRVLAGWVWLLAAVAVFLSWQAVLALASDGGFGIDTTRHLYGGPVPENGLVARSVVREVPWTTPAWQWLLPVTGATIAYLLASAINLATRHPLRIVGGIIIALLLLGLATGEYVFDWIRVGLYHTLDHPWGLDTVITGGSESLKVALSPDLSGVAVWRELPTFGAWLGATLLWAAISFVAVWAATFRLRER